MNQYNNEFNMQTLAAKVHTSVKEVLDKIGHRPGVTVKSSTGRNPTNSQCTATCLISDDVLGLRYELTADASLMANCGPAKYAPVMAAEVLRGYLNQEVNMELGLFVPAANRMVTIRPIRGSYNEAMKAACTIPAMDDRLELMMLPWYGPISPLADGDNPCFTYSGGEVDGRNGWKTYLICRNGMPCAYASGPIGDAA